jgi:hypothetical protein
MTLAFPSSPHCVPTTTVAGTLVQVTRAATHRSRKAGQGISQASLLLNGHSCAVKHASMKMDYIQTAALVADNYSCASLFKIKTVLHVGSDAFDLQHFKHRHFPGEGFENDDSLFSPRPPWSHPFGWLAQLGNKRHLAKRLARNGFWFARKIWRRKRYLRGQRTTSSDDLYRFPLRNTPVVTIKQK